MHERKKHVLKATINHYINTAEPVSSQTLCRYYHFNVSSATIRHNLKDLEKEQFLSQVHPSSGRIPTDKGYRFYVDELMTKQYPSSEHIAHLKKELASLGPHIKDTLNYLSKMMAHLCSYATFIFLPNIYQSPIETLQMMTLSSERLLALFLNTKGIVFERMLFFTHHYKQDDLNHLCTQLSKTFNGQTLTDIETGLACLATDACKHSALYRTLTTALSKQRHIAQQERPMICSGMSNLLELPEFNNIDLTKKVLDILDQQHNLLKTTLSSIDHSQQNIVIGKENKLEQLEECSIVMEPFFGKGQSKGVLGILGPKRMTYALTVPFIKQISQCTSNILNEEEDNK